MVAPAIVASHKLMRIYTGGLTLYPSFLLNSFLWLVTCSDNVAKWLKHLTADHKSFTHRILFFGGHFSPWIP